MYAFLSSELSWSSVTTEGAREDNAVEDAGRFVRGILDKNSDSGRFLELDEFKILALKL